MQQPEDNRRGYLARINRVVDHIDAHLAAPLDLATLAQVAHFSPWHFHRIFQALTGETLAERVRRRRLETAAARLLATPPRAALAIALDVGFASPEVFTRAFKAHFGVTPSAWRRGAWRGWAEQRRLALRKIHQAMRKPDQAVDALFRDDDAWQLRHDHASQGVTMDIEMRTLAPLTLAYLRHTGPYGSPAIGQMWGRFAAWCDKKGLFTPGRVIIGISQDSPDITAADKLRYDACVEVDAGFHADGEIGVQTIAGGRYACARFDGTGAQIHTAWMALYGDWLPGSGHQCADSPCIEWYDQGPGVDAQGRFSCLLCLPLR